MAIAALTTPATVALVGAGCVAAVNWWSVTVGRRKVEWATKPTVMVLLVVAAITLTPVDGAVRAWIVVGLVLSLAGDVFLMLPKERFIEGLGSFLLAHVAYIVALLITAHSLTGAAVGLVFVAAMVAVIGAPIVRAVRKRPESGLLVPVIVYLAVISAMVVAAVSTTNPWAIAGALLFYVSDGVLAYNKFVKPIPMARPAIMSTYHAAQFGLTLSLLA